MAFPASLDSISKPAGTDAMSDHAELHDSEIEAILALNIVQSVFDSLPVVDVPAKGRLKICPLP